MATTSPARIDDELYASAKLAGSVQSRSASQQVAHWARIGREIEASSNISHKEIAAVLAGSRSYDGLSPKEQAVVRAEWAARIDEARAALDLAKDFARAGRTWVELDDKGRVVERGRAETRTKKPATKKRATPKRTAAASKSVAAARAKTKKTPVRAAS
jgi:hypothetical protein